MDKAYITKELLTENDNQLPLYYSENLDMYITENFLIGAGCCDVEDGIEIKDMKECFDFSEDYIEEMIEKTYDYWNGYWDTINIDEHIKDNFVRLHNSTGYVEIHKKYFDNIIKPLNYDISLLPLPPDGMSILLIENDAIIMPQVFKVVDNSEIDIAETLYNEDVPDDIKENFIFSYASFFKNGKAVVKYENWCGELDKNGKLLNKFICKDLFCCESFNHITFTNKEGIIDKNGNFIIKSIYDKIYPCYSTERLWKVINDNKHGIVDDNNNIIWELKYDMIKTLYNKKEQFIVSENGKFGVIDIHKNIIIPFMYDDLEQYYNDDKLLFAVKNNKHGIIDMNNNIIVPFIYKELSLLGSNNLCAKITDDKYIIINKQNEEISKTIFKEIYPYCFNKDEDVQIYPTKIENLYGFIDEFGNTKIDFKYQHAETFSNGYCIVKTKDDKSFLIDTDDNIVITDFCYDPWIDTIDKDRIIVGNFGWGHGIIDSRNNKIIDSIFDSIGFHICLRGEYFSANYNGKYGFIDRNGKALKINKESLNIPETKINYNDLNTKDMVDMIFT